jgi:hypothetical protein
MKTNCQQYATVLAAALAVALFTGCASPTPRGILGPKAGVPAGESVVFGEIKLEANLSHHYDYVSVINTRSSIPVLEQPVANEKTPFFWHLPPGKYAVFELEFVWGGGGDIHSRSGRIYAEFDVASAGQVVYTGCLGLVLQSGGIKATVSDDFENALGVLKTNRPQVVGEPDKHLFTLETKR